MQILVTYYSRTGNTEELAKMVGDGVLDVDDVDLLLKPVADVTEEDVLSSRGIIAGSPVYFGAMAAELKAFFDGLVGIRHRMGNKVGAAFATSGGVATGTDTAIISIIQAMLMYGMIVVGHPLDATAHYGASCVGSPDEFSDCDAAGLGRRVAVLAKKLQ